MKRKRSKFGAKNTKRKSNVESKVASDKKEVIKNTEYFDVEENESDASTYSSSESTSVDSEEERHWARLHSRLPIAASTCPDVIDLDFEFSYLSKKYTIREMITKILPPTTIPSVMELFVEKSEEAESRDGRSKQDVEEKKKKKKKKKTKKKKKSLKKRRSKKPSSKGKKVDGDENLEEEEGRTPEQCMAWYRAWFYLCDPGCSFSNMFNNCVEALDLFGEPKNYNVSPTLIRDMKEERDWQLRKKEEQAAKEAPLYDLPAEILLTKMYADGKKRNNAECDPAKFYYSYLMTTLEDKNFDTTTKIGSSKRPICKVLYHHEKFLRGKTARNTNPKLFKFELFIGPFLSEDDSRAFNIVWGNHRGAGPRREFAKRYAQKRGMLCFDARAFQKTDEIERLRKEKKCMRSRRNNFAL